MRILLYLGLGLVALSLLWHGLRHVWIQAFPGFFKDEPEETRVTWLETLHGRVSIGLLVLMFLAMAIMRVVETAR